MDSVTREILKLTHLGYIAQLDDPVYYNPGSLGMSAVTLLDAGGAVSSEIIDIGQYSKHRLIWDIAGPGSGASVVYIIQASTYAADDTALGSVNLVQNYGKMYSGISKQFAWVPGINNGFFSPGLSATLCGGLAGLLIGVKKVQFKLYTSLSPDHGSGLWLFNLHYLGKRY